MTRTEWQKEARKLDKIQQKIDRDKGQAQVALNKEWDKLGPCPEENHE